MIGFLEGRVLFSDGTEVILKTKDGIGHQIFCQQVLIEGQKASLYISHVIKEASQQLFAFRSLRDKKLFELLTSVKGVGPKSAYALTAHFTSKQIIEAIQLENKKALTAAPGVGPKAAAQMILDLSSKIHKIQMYAINKEVLESAPVYTDIRIEDRELPADTPLGESRLIDETILACKELGFSEEAIIPVAQEILKANSVSRAEQLVHLVLKEL
ncbi:MAG: Holliday junction branch migration protein RuvA [Halobacteriovoraceae bacterium]|jgi:holliday junction DNA helicase RuvA|nr:Holliday junction branch migration protein RuvA [Halobacteriovoraceae bacterium]MBT5092809.1 Holliday junction branch migration protein RuvA [Halobacteriovoraceae bacterium]